MGERGLLMLGPRLKQMPTTMATMDVIAMLPAPIQAQMAMLPAPTLAQMAMLPAPNLAQMAMLNKPMVAMELLDTLLVPTLASPMVPSPHMDEHNKTRPSMLPRSIYKKE